MIRVRCNGCGRTHEVTRECLEYGLRGQNFEAEWSCAACRTDFETLRADAELGAAVRAMTRFCSLHRGCGDWTYRKWVKGQPVELMYHRGDPLEALRAGGVATEDE